MDYDRCPLYLLNNRVREDCYDLYRISMELIRYEFVTTALTVELLIFALKRKSPFV